MKCQTDMEVMSNSFLPKARFCERNVIVTIIGVPDSSIKVGVDIGITFDVDPHLEKNEMFAVSESKMLLCLIFNSNWLETSSY